MMDADKNSSGHDDQMEMFMEALTQFYPEAKISRLNIPNAPGSFLSTHWDSLVGEFAIGWIKHSEKIVVKDVSISNNCYVVLFDKDKNIYRDLLLTGSIYLKNKKD